MFECGEHEEKKRDDDYDDYDYDYYDDDQDNQNQRFVQVNKNQRFKSYINFFKITSIYKVKMVFKKKKSSSCLSCS
jgi:hypothetical protein